MMTMTMDLLEAANDAELWTVVLPGQQQSSVELDAGAGVWSSAQRGGHVDTQL